MSRPPGATRTVADWVVSSPSRDLPSAVLEQAKRHIIDTVGVTVAGAQSPAANIVGHWAITQDAGGRSTVLGRGAAVSARTAALVNGVAAHALDFDDQSYSELGHASTVVLPAALAACEDAGLGGRALIVAYLAGMEVAGKLGAAMNPDLFRRGWHTTGVVGALASAAACAVPLQLTGRQAADALGIATVRAGGMRANNGSLTKAYQAGQAAEAGIVSAQLAQHGLDASPDILGAPDGLIQIVNDGVFSADPLDHLGAPFDVLDPGVMVKRYPACSALATVLDAVFDLAATADLRPENVDEIRCTMTPLAFHSVPITTPETPYQGKFSAPFCLAAAIVTGRVDLNTFTTRTFHDERIWHLMDRVELVADPGRGWAPPDAPEEATVRVTTTDGRQLERHCAHPVGSPSNRMSDAALEEKFLLCTSPVLGREYVGTLLDHLWQLESLSDLTSVHRLTRPLGTGV